MVAPGAADEVGAAAIAMGAAGLEPVIFQKATKLFCLEAP